MANFKLALVQHNTAVLAVTEFDSYELLHEAATGNGVEMSDQFDDCVPISYDYMEGLPFNPDTTTMLNGQLYITNSQDLMDHVFKRGMK